MPTPSISNSADRGAEDNRTPGAKGSSKVKFVNAALKENEDFKDLEIKFDKQIEDL